jgi:crotonobetaine/carnitine-CoA ligase
VIDDELLPAITDTLREGTSLLGVVVIGDRDVPELPVPTLRATAICAAATPMDGDGPEPWDTSCMIFTSGTTGPSKGVLVPWGEMYCMATITYDVAVFDETDAFFCPWPTCHIGGRFPPYTMALAGGSVVFKRRFSLSTWLEEVRSSGCTATNMMELMSSQVRDWPDGSFGRPHPIRHVFGPIIPDIAGFIRDFGLESYRSGFGMTEMSMVIMDQGRPGRGQMVGKLHEGFPGYEMRIVDEHDRPVPTGEVGELIVRSREPWTMNTGYFGMPAETAAAWRNGWFHSGDAMRVDADGNCQFIDRMKDCIRRRAENISSFEVEAYVAEHPEVAEAAAVAGPSEIVGDEEVRVFVVRRPGSTLEAAELVDFLVPRMPRFMVPRYVQFVDELPRTAATAKIRKAELRALPIDDGVWDRVAHQATRV